MLQLASLWRRREGYTAYVFSKPRNNPEKVPTCLASFEEIHAFHAIKIRHKFCFKIAQIDAVCRQRAQNLDIGVQWDKDTRRQDAESSKRCSSIRSPEEKHSLYPALQLRKINQGLQQSSGMSFFVSGWTYLFDNKPAIAVADEDKLALLQLQLAILIFSWVKMKQHHTSSWVTA